MLAYEAKECWKLNQGLALNVGIEKVEATSFFFARSPDAPSMTKMVFSCISREADMLFRVWLVDPQGKSVTLTGRLAISKQEKFKQPRKAIE